MPATKRRRRVLSPEAKAKERLRAAEWRRAHPEEYKAYLAKWRASLTAKDKLRIKKQNHDRYVADRAGFKERQARWRQDNLERARLLRRVGEARRRALQRAAPGTASIMQIEARIAYYGWRCWMCRQPWEQLDHVIPLSRGGTNWASNFRPACGPCNARKKDKHPREMDMIRKYSQGQVIPEQDPEIQKQAGKGWSKEDEEELQREGHDQR